MKTRIVVLLAGILLLSSCAATFDQTLLRPTEGSIDPKLPRLELKKSSEQVSSADAKQITSNSKMYTLFEREYDEFCEQRGEVLGYIEPVITLNHQTNIGWGFYALSIVTVLIPNLFGMPVIGNNYQLEVEFEITNLENEKIWKKTYYETKKFYYGFYNMNKSSDQVMLMYRQMIRDFKDDMQKDIHEVRAELMQQ